MNLIKIRAHAMLGVSRIWMEDEVLGGELAAHPLGRAAAGELDVVHGRLATALDERRQTERQVTELTEKIASAAARFARKGRALHGAFEVLANLTDDSAEEARYRRLQTLFFPIGLRIFQRTHLEGSGAVEEARTRATPGILAELAGITLAGRTLADLYHAWVDAGRELRRYLSERTRMREGLRRGGSKAASIDIKAARAEWVRLVRMLFTVADMIRLSGSGRERLQGPLRRAVSTVESPRPEAGIPADEFADDADALQALAGPISESIEKGTKNEDWEEDAENGNVSEMRDSDYCLKLMDTDMGCVLEDIATKPELDRALPERVPARHKN